MLPSVNRNAAKSAGLAACDQEIASRWDAVNLSNFIQSHMDTILAEWDAFARASEPDEGTMSDEALRDHARAMLDDIADEMDLAQSEHERRRKSEGHEPRRSEKESAASKHGRERHLNDFTLVTLGAEFRALRATVLRLWQPYMEHADASALEQVIRFNEGIDKALAESISAWSNRTNHVRELFLAILGHDLRSPLASVALAGDMLVQPDMSGERVNRLALNVTRAAGVMSNMIDDLMGYASTQLGGNMPHHPESCDLLPALRDAIVDAEATYRGASFQLQAPPHWSVATTASACTRCSSICWSMPPDTARTAARSSSKPATRLMAAW